MYEKSSQRRSIELLTVSVLADQIKYKGMVSFSSALERMRQKPESVRIRYLFFFVGVSFVSIIVLWVFSLQASLGTFFKSDAVDAVRESAQNVGKNAPVSLEDLMKAGKTLREGGEALRESMPSPVSQPVNVSPQEEATPPKGEAAALSVPDASGNALSEGERQDMPKPKAMPEASSFEGNHPPSPDGSVSNSGSE